MKYVKGNQSYKLDDLELCKVRLVFEGCGEGIWVKQGDGEVILQNHSLAFFPFPSWGVVLKSEYDTEIKTDNRETIDVTDLIHDGIPFVIHPETWAHYIEEKYISEDGIPLEQLKLE